MLDVAVSYNRYKFLGYEFLVWLWFMIEKDPDAVNRMIGGSGRLQIGNRIVLENRYGQDSKETVTIKVRGISSSEGRSDGRSGVSKRTAA